MGASPKKEDEGPRSFTRFLEKVDDGQGVVELSAAQYKLLNEVREVAGRSGNDAKGVLTLKLSYAGQPNGTVDVRYDITVKGPKKKLGRSVFFLTPGGNLTLENPRQLGLGLPVRDVSTSKHFQDVEADNDVEVKDL